MELIVDAGSVTTALIALAGFGVALWRWVIRPGKALLEHVHEVITHELQPNGGSSLADNVRRIESKLDDHLLDAEAHFAEQHNRRRRYDPDHQDHHDAGT